MLSDVMQFKHLLPRVEKKCRYVILSSLVIKPFLLFVFSHILTPHSLMSNCWSFQNVAMEITVHAESIESPQTVTQKIFVAVCRMRVKRKNSRSFKSNAYIHDSINATCLTDHKEAGSHVLRRSLSALRSIVGGKSESSSISEVCPLFSAALTSVVNAKDKF